MAGNSLPVSFAIAGSDSTSVVRVVLAKLCGGSASVTNETTGLLGANTRTLALPTSLAAGAAYVYAVIASGTGAGARSASISVTVTQYVDPCAASQSSALLQKLLQLRACHCQRLPVPLLQICSHPLGSCAAIRARRSSVLPSLATLPSPAPCLLRPSPPSLQARAAFPCP